MLGLTAHQPTIQQAKNTPYEQKLRELIGQPIVLANSSGVFNDINYHKIKDVLGYCKKNKDFMKRHFVLNNLVKYLDRHNMLPAICFVFSRKNVELCAKEIDFSLFLKR